MHSSSHTHHRPPTIPWLNSNEIPLIYQHQLCNYSELRYDDNTENREHMKIIIDGYNLIRQSRSLLPFEKQSLEGGRRELIRRLAQFKKIRHHSITVVFDGWAGDSPNEERHVEKGITVIYSKRGEKADDVIIRMVPHGGSQYIVVTSDRGVADAITKRGATAISSPEFEMRMHMPLPHDSPGETYDVDGEDDGGEPAPGKRKGPSKRLPKKKRRAVARLKKL